MRAWVWGAGDAGRVTLGLLTRQGRHVDGIVDSKKRGQLDGYEIQPPEAVQPGDHVIVASAWAREVAEAATARGATVEFSLLWYSRSKGPFKWSADHDHVCQILDDESRNIYVEIIRAWIEDRPPELGDFGSYEWGLLGDMHGTRVIDGGACDGEEIDGLLERGASHILCVEPLPRPYLLSMASQGRSIHLLQAVFGAAPGWASLSLAGSASGLDPVDPGAETITVPMITLSSLPPAEIVKIDIEGAEVRVLREAAGWLQAYCRGLAVCIYHRWSDLTEIPLMLRAMQGTRRWTYHVRHHSQSLADTVLYVRMEG